LIEGTATDWRDQAVTEFGGVNSLAFTQRMLRRGDLKYGYNAVGADELYDLAVDPHETCNLIAHPDYRTALHDLRDRLAAWMRDTHDGALNMFNTAMRYEERR
jgi:hypothetical protein